MTARVTQRLDDVVDMEQLADMLRRRYITRRQHPHLPLAIFNYSHTAMFDRVWNAATRTCRGLIVDTNTLEIVARPFRKFFNHGQAEAADLDTTGPVRVTDKADGSLGILYPIGNGRYAVASRGSFTSEPARHATELWNNYYGRFWTPPLGLTTLFEIVYPQNRIVLDYGTMDDLILLGFVDASTGRTHGPRDVSHGWPGPTVDTLPYNSLVDALTAPPRLNAEGMVLHFLDTDERLKIKQADYLALHAVLTTCSARRLWLHLAARACPAPGPDAKPGYYGTVLKADPVDVYRCLALGDTWLEQILAGVPDEFYTWVQQQIAHMTSSVEQLRDRILADHDQFLAEIGPDRRAFGIAVRERKHPHFGAILRHADGGDLTAYLWLAVKPEHELPFMARDEDVA